MKLPVKIGEYKRVRGQNAVDHFLGENPASGGNIQISDQLPIAVGTLISRPVVVKVGIRAQLCPFSCWTGWFP